MCLKLKNNEVKAKVAKEDIKCYKVILKYTDNNYETPYQHFSIEMGKTYESELIKEDDKIEKGLHSFKTLKDAKFECGGWIIGILVECIIPKGVKYYEGMFGDYVSYASNMLTYVKII